MNYKSILICIIGFISGLSSAIMIIGINKGFINPNIVLCIFIPCYILLKIYNFRKKAKKDD